MKKSEPFRFKFFTIRHDQCAMKVGTDAVLLGAWANVNGSQRILDVGTGCGVIALMLAQRTHEKTVVDAIERESQDAAQAAANVLESPWAKKIFVYPTPLQEFFPPKRYDLIVSNPPYFVNSLKPPAQSRTKARHTVGLRFDELITHSIRLLNPGGRLAVILPFAEGKIFKTLATENQFYLIREAAIFTRADKPQERWLSEFSRSESPVIQERLILQDAKGSKSDDYYLLTKDFYL